MKNTLRKNAFVDRGRCVACGACVKECPRGALTIWKGCFAKVDTELCVGCGKCANICPAGSIEIKSLVDGRDTLEQ